MELLLHLVLALHTPHLGLQDLPNYLLDPQLNEEPILLSAISSPTYLNISNKAASLLNFNLSIFEQNPSYCSNFPSFLVNFGLKDKISGIDSI